MIFSVLPGTRLGEIPKDAKQLHFVRPVKRKLFEGILRKCSGLEGISMSSSCMQRTPRKSLAMLRKKGVKIAAARRQGRPIGVPLQKMQHALELRRDYQSLREVERVPGISKSTVHYLEKYAQRSKIKSGKGVIYLK